MPTPPKKPAVPKKAAAPKIPTWKDWIGSAKYDPEYQDYKAQSNAADTLNKGQYSANIKRANAAESTALDRLKQQYGQNRVGTQETLAARGLGNSGIASGALTKLSNENLQNQNDIRNVRTQGVSNIIAARSQFNLQRGASNTDAFRAAMRRRAAKYGLEL